MLSVTDWFKNISEIIELYTFTAEVRVTAIFYWWEELSMRQWYDSCPVFWVFSLSKGFLVWQVVPDHWCILQTNPLSWYIRHHPVTQLHISEEWWLHPTPAYFLNRLLIFSCWTNYLLVSDSLSQNPSSIQVLTMSHKSICCSCLPGGSHSWGFPTTVLCAFNVPQLNFIDAALQEMLLDLTWQPCDGVWHNLHCAVC